MFWKFYNAVMREVVQFGRKEWIALSLVCVVVGFLCMRGYGSRKDY